MLIAAVSELKIAVIGILCFLGLVALVVYLPIALVHEVTRSEKEVLPEWMGSVRARRARLRVVLFFLGIVLMVFIGAAVYS